MRLGRSKLIFRCTMMRGYNSLAAEGEIPTKHLKSEVEYDENAHARRRSFKRLFYLEPAFTRVSFTASTPIQIVSAKRFR